MSQPNIPQHTPFDHQLQDDIESRRTSPTASTIRIGDNVKGSVVTQTTIDDIASAAPIRPQERTPLPIIVAVAMAIGAICVMGGAFVIRRIVPDTRPAFPTTTQNPSSGDVIMNPDLVTQNPGDGAIEEVAPQETPSIEIEELPAAEREVSEGKTKQSSSTSAAPPSAQRSEGNDEDNGNDRNNHPEKGTFSANEPFTGPTYELTPPPGYSLSQKGRRTIWKHENGAQLLVETGKAGAGSLRDGWLRLERDLKKRYGAHYKSLGITESQLAGQPAAVWEFELTGKDGITRRKIDIGLQYKGRGYAVLGSAPKENFDKVFPEIRAALDSFKLKEKQTIEEAQAPAHPRKAAHETASPKTTLPPKKAEQPDVTNDNSSESPSATRSPVERGY